MYIKLVKSGMIFHISPWRHMLWVLIRSTSISNEYPQHNYVSMENWRQLSQNYQQFWTLFSILFWPKVCFLCSCFLTLKCKENLLYMSFVYVVCWIFLQTFQTYFCIKANIVHPDQTAPRAAVWSRSTLFAKMTFKITSRWQSRRQLLWLAV